MIFTEEEVQALLRTQTEYETDVKEEIEFLLRMYEMDTLPHFGTLGLLLKDLAKIRARIKRLQMR